MRRAVAIITLAVVCVAASGAGAASGRQATLRFIDLIPVKARGAHFVPRQEVRVTLRAGSAKRVRTIRTSATGVFTVDFGTLLKQDRCSGSVSVVAVGVGGERVVYKLPPMACPTAAIDKQTA